MIFDTPDNAGKPAVGQEFDTINDSKKSSHIQQETQFKLKNVQIKQPDYNQSPLRPMDDKFYKNSKIDESSIDKVKKPAIPDKRQTL